MLLEGLFVPLTTPFYPDGRLYLRKLEHNVERYSRTPAAGLALLTPTGEGAMLNDRETLDALRTGAAIAAPEKVLLADCGRTSVAASLELLHASAELGYDAALLRSPASTMSTTPSADRERDLWFRALADRSPLPLLLADDARAPLPLPLIAELARSQQVLGWVCAGDAERRIPAALEATADISREVPVTPVFAAVTGRMLRPDPGARPEANYVSAASLTAGANALAVEPPPRPALRTRTRRVGFQVLAGTSGELAAALRAGARGALLPLSACAPQAASEVFAAWKDDDQSLLDEKAARLASARWIEEELGPAGCKAGCDRNGYFGGSPRLPLTPLLAEQARELERLLKGMRH